MFRYDPVDNAQKRKWLKYADGVYEPVRNDGNLKRKKDDSRQFQWWQVVKPADWKPKDEGAEFSWNHTLGSKADLADQTTGKPLAAKGDQPEEEKPKPVQPKPERPKSPGRHDGFPSWQSLLANGGAAAEDLRRKKRATLRTRLPPQRAAPEAAWCSPKARAKWARRAVMIPC